MEYNISAMGISPSIISSIIRPILVMLVIMALSLGLLWLLYKVNTIFYRWLSQRKFFIQFRQRRQARKRKKDISQKVISRKRKMSFGEFLAEVFAEPVILTIAIVILYDHFKDIWDTSPDFATFWFRINETTGGNLLVVLFVLIAVTLWMAVVILRRNREEQRDKAFEELQKTNTDKLVELLKTNNDELKESLKTNSEQMRQVAESIKELAMEIRKNTNDKHGKPSTEM